MDKKPMLKKQLVRSTSAQINLFVDYMAANKDFANGLGKYAGVVGAKKADREWEALRKRLREHGADKTVPQWKQTWRDLKRKARRAVKENKDAMPIVSDSTFKVLETIGPVGLDCSIQIHTPENHTWEKNVQEDSHMENEVDIIKNSNDYDEESERVSEADTEDVKDVNSEVEIMVTLPQIKDMYVEPGKKAPFDPLQDPVSNVTRLPRLVPKPAMNLMYPRSPSPPSPFSPPGRAPQYPSITRRILKTRKRKPSSVYTSNIFIALEQRRIKLEEERDKRLHEREMERLKLELQRIEVQRDHNELLQHLVNIVQNACELLQQKLQ